MKNLKYLSLLLLAVLSIAFVSCKDDDDVNKNDLVGTWQSTWNKGYERYADHPDWNEECDEAYTEETITFNSDQTGTDGEGFSFTWNLDGDQLTLKFAEESQTAKVAKLNSSELVIEFFEEGTGKNGPYEYFDQTTYKK